MTTYEQALAILRERVRPLGVERVAVEHCAGRVLAEDLVALADSPPFDRSAMDGFAVRSGDVRELPATLELAGESYAGDWPAFEVGPGQCARIATGAPVPPGADMVVMVEHTAEASGGAVRVERLTGGNICFRGEDIRAGGKLLAAGTKLTPLLAAVAASAGHGQVPVARRPRAAVLCTGAELVAPPGPARLGQVFNSNAPMLLNLLRPVCGSLESLGVVGDKPENTEQAIRRGLEADLLVMSGGVSVGERDLVPGALARQGVETLFHKVAIRPGKPVLCGLKGGTLVFALPGNPFSCFAVQHVLMSTAIDLLCGAKEPGPKWEMGALLENVRDRSGRETFLPCRTAQEGAQVFLRPVEWHGSGDIAGGGTADALLAVPLEAAEIKAGGTVMFSRV